MPFSSFRPSRLDTAVSADLIRQIAAIYELKGKQRLYEQQAPEVLEHLRRSAIIESSESSSRIEGVVASPDRVREIVGLGAAPLTRSEAEIAGYRDVLATIHASYPHIQVRPNTILQFHRDLFRLAGVAGGAWKNADNTIDATLPDGSRETVFRPAPAYMTETAMIALCEDFNAARNEHSHEDLILIAAFILDFLSIHPFSDGNGRIARLLTTLLLYQSGFAVGRYVSIERVVEQTRDSYYASLRASSEGWQEGTHSLAPWVGYFFGVVLAAFRELDTRLQVAGMPTKAQRVKLAIEQLPDLFTITEIERACPAVSRPTIKLVLRELREQGRIEVARAGRGATWRKRR